MYLKYVLQFSNIVWRMAMEKMTLKLIDRNYFDSQAAIPVPGFGLKVWPGYATTIRQQENELMLCVDVAHKILRYRLAELCCPIYFFRPTLGILFPTISSSLGTAE